MDKKVWSTLVALIVVLIIAIGGYSIYHNSHKTTSSSSNTGNATSTSTNSNVASVNNTVLITKTSSSQGSYLTSPNGMTLYTYSADGYNSSNCSGGCLTAWPAYQDKGSTTSLPAGVSTIKRSDNGQIQYTYKGKPLYFYVGDKSAGQITGSGIAGWSVAKP